MILCSLASLVTQTIPIVLYTLAYIHICAVMTHLPSQCFNTLLLFNQYMLSISRDNSTTVGSNQVFKSQPRELSSGTKKILFANFKFVSIDKKHYHKMSDYSSELQKIMKFLLLTNLSTILSK